MNASMSEEQQSDLAKYVELNAIGIASGYLINNLLHAKQIADLKKTQVKVVVKGKQHVKFGTCLA